ncbi:PHD finger protein EHD3-like [Durio zibethinus]|uniref:PHD finger protein EHD3-like n=1 Tax=Durio zibethinus TaxID=66656 RepID=A0A6P6ATB3_DURZI|nr:PHD finger protein EHD3-like [Durio zibethinus]XP_022768061.1 PHD finger protein EHD3-like [Durio zibethinus]
MGVDEETSNGEGAECGDEIQCFKSEPVNNGFGIEFVNDSGDGSSGASENFRTYKRRKQLMSSSKIKMQNVRRASTDQVALPGTDHCASFNDSNYLLQRKWRNVVLEHMHQLLSGDEGGIQRCIQDALLFHQENGCNVTVKDSDASHEDSQKCSLQAGQIPNGTKHTAQGLEGVISNGSFKESYPQTTTEMCQHVFFDVISSEKFTSLCKLLFDNFQEIKLDSLFHLSLLNSRMKDGVYEHSPGLFSSDIQTVWRKLQEIGTEIVSLAKSLSNISSTSYGKQVGCPHGAVEEEKHEFYPRELESCAKPEQNEACGVYKVCTCRHCGEKADGKDCLVCDSCEKMYHVACLEPAVKEIPPKSWYCSSCTANGIGSSHVNCVICERLNAPRTLNNNVAGENYNAKCETFCELEEISNCSVDNGLQLSPESKIPYVCKICARDIEKREKLRCCEHPYCPNKYYHVRCLTRKQLKSYCARWYCPSCLCRACLVDKDDDKIVLCDGCDAAYHIYCIKPPRTSIPRGKWFCKKCDAGIQRIRRAKRACQNLENKLKIEGVGKMTYDNLETSLNHRDKEELDKSRGGVDMLLTAASTLHFEEKLSAIQMKS